MTNPLNEASAPALTAGLVSALEALSIARDSRWPETVVEPVAAALARRRDALQDELAHTADMETRRTLRRIVDAINEAGDMGWAMCVDVPPAVPAQA